MASKFIKPEEGSACAVATCMYHNASKAKRDEKEVSFYKFPKNFKLQKQWTLKCKRMDNLNPFESYICSNHFCENDFVRDLKAELFESNPKKLLKSDAVPTQNLPIDHVEIPSTSAMNHDSTIESETIKQANDQIVITTEESLTHPSTSTSTSTSSPILELEQLLKMHREMLLDKYNSQKESNASLLLDLEVLKNTLRTTNLKIAESDRRMEVLNQTMALIQQCAKEFRMGWHKKN